VPRGVDAASAALDHLLQIAPRRKQLFAFLTGAGSEQELDAIMRDMTMDGYMARITSPTLLTVGYYDPRAPLEELFPLFDHMTAPGELWVMADQHHSLSGDGGPNDPALVSRRHWFE
jgi:pimeloyl-ACP methyl ester carboxylesterase